MEAKLEKNIGDKEITLSPEEKKLAQSIENCSFLESRDKMFILLIWRGLKTASAISIPLYVTEEEIFNLENILKNMNLFFQSSEGVARERHLGLQHGKIFFVANNQQDLDLISKLWFGDHVKDEQVYKEIGRMSGFPQTAIDVYDKFTKLEESERTNVAKTLILSPEEKLQKIPNNLYPFSLFFYMSKEHWQEELKTISTWAEEIKKLAPTLYKEILEDMNN